MTRFKLKNSRFLTQPLQIVEMNVSIFNGQHAQKINLRLMKQIAETLLAELEIQNAELEIDLVAVEKMTWLNETFLRHKGSTDVIAFDYRNPDSEIRNPKFQISGEIFICVDEAVWQARTFRTIWQSEIVRYLIHGVLHLLGHDDRRSGERRKMKHEENRLLRQLSRQFSLAQLCRHSKLGA